MIDTDTVQLRSISVYTNIFRDKELQVQSPSRVVTQEREHFHGSQHLNPILDSGHGSHKGDMSRRKRENSHYRASDLGLTKYTEKEEGYFISSNIVVFFIIDFLNLK